MNVSKLPIQKRLAKPKFKKFEISQFLLNTENMNIMKYIINKLFEIKNIYGCKINCVLPM